MAEDPTIDTMPRQEAAMLFRTMRLNKFEEFDAKDFVKTYHHLFSKAMVSDVSAAGCPCNNFESFKMDWRHDQPSEAEIIVEESFCTHPRLGRSSYQIGFYPIHIAAGLGSLKLFNCILDQDGDMYRTTVSERIYAFDIAIMNKHYAVAKSLLSRRFRYPDDERTEALRNKMIATCIYLNYLDSADLCIKAGATITLEHWKRLMYRAVEHSRIDVVKWLLDMGIGGVDEKINHGYPALHFAASVEVAQHLLDRGADPSIVCDPDGTALMRQLKRKRLEVAQCILKHDKSVVDQMVTNAPTSRRNHYTALQNCAWQDYLEGIQLLCEYGADHRLVTYDGNTAVGLACHSGSLECVEYLLGLGCDTNCQDKDGDTALLYATYNGNWEIVEMLLENGAEPERGNKFGVTPIWNAVYSRTLPSVIRLLSLNVDPGKCCRGRNIFEQQHFNFIYDDLVSPLFVAIHHQDVSIAKALIAAGCYINAEDFGLVNFRTYVDGWAGDNKKWLRHVTSTPPTLSWWCKRLIRKHLPVNPESAIQGLFIPYTLKAYIQEI